MAKGRYSKSRKARTGHNVKCHVVSIEIPRDGTMGTCWSGNQLFGVGINCDKLTRVCTLVAILDGVVRLTICTDIM
jgi:hypothetical protein